MVKKDDALAPVGSEEKSGLGSAVVIRLFLASRFQAFLDDFFSSRS
jgi:hypothetical protein